VFRKLKIFLPPLKEQKAIAQILSTSDKAIQKVDEIIAKTERLKKGLMQKLLTKGIEHKEFKDTEIGKIPKEWKVVKLEDVVEIWDKYRVPVKERDRRPGPFPYCGANGVIDYIDGYTHDGKFVLLAEDGGFFGSFENSAYIMQGKFWANNHVHILKAIEGVLINEFLMFYLNFINLIPFLTGSTRPKLTQEDMRKIPILLPPLSEQQKIVEILSTIDKKLELERKRREKLEKIKKGLMNDLLTGKIRIKV
jgi:type I restriction enzyme S subunit